MYATLAHNGLNCEYTNTLIAVTPSAASVAGISRDPTEARRPEGVSSLRLGNSKVSGDGYAQVRSFRFENRRQLDTYAYSRRRVGLGLPSAT